MFKRGVSHHRRAERLLDAATQHLIEAFETVQLAHESNRRAAEAHKVAIDYHTQGLAEVASRDYEIAYLRDKVSTS